MWPMRPLVVAAFLLGWLAAAGDHCASGGERLDSWRQTRQGWQRCEEFLAPPIEYRCPALHPAVVGSLEVLLSVTALLALGDGRRATAIKARRASEVIWSRSPSGRGRG